MKVNGHLLFNADGSGELQNAHLQSLANNPTGTTSRVYYNTGDNTVRYYDGSDWQSLGSAGGLTALQNEVDAMQTASGGIFDTDGTFSGTGLDALGNITGSTSLLDALTQLDAAITAAAGVDTLGDLTDVTVTSLAIGHVLYADSTTTWANAAPGATSGVQGYDAGLDSIAGLTTAADTMIYTTALDTYATTSLTSFARTLLDDVDQAAMQTTLGVYSTTTADSTFVDVAGDTMTGLLVLSADPTAALGAATKQYVDVVGTDVTALITLSGVAAESVNLGTFTGNTISDNVTVKTALQELETEVELKADDADVIKKDGSVAFTADQSMGGFKLTNLDTPTASGDATTKAYVDLVSTSGTRHKGSAIVATTANITLSGTQTIDGVAVVADDIVLVKDQTDATENGAYTVAAVAWTRTDNFDGQPSNEIQGGDLIYVDQGTVNANTLFFVMGTGEKAINVDDIEFDIFSRAESITASTGLTKVGLDVRLAASSAGDGLDFTAGVLSVNVDDASLEINTDTLRIKDLGVTTAKLDATSVTAAKLGSDVAGAGLAGGNGSALTVEYSTTGEADHAVEASSLAATTTGLGASLVGVFDTADNFTATTVEGVLAELQGNIDAAASALDDLTDVEATTYVAGDTLVADGTNSYDAKTVQYTFEATGTAQTSYTIAHGLGQFVNVTVLESATNEVIIPQSITMNSTGGGELVVTLTSALLLKVVIMGFNPAVTQVNI